MIERRKLNLVVLMGGPSSEHDISLKTGETLIRNLNPQKYNLKPIIITKDKKWISQKGYVALGEKQNQETPSITLPQEYALSYIKNEDPADVVFIAMHGEYGEDGAVQGLLDATGIPYTGSGVLASSLGMNKPASLRLFRERGLFVPDFMVLTKKDGVSEEIEMDKFKFPLVVKPADRGSSVGISIIREQKELKGAIEKAFGYSQEIMIQRYIPGREVTCGVIDNGLGEITSLQPTEIIPKERSFFDYYSKYTPYATQEITPPNLPEKITRDIQQTALETHAAIGCSGMSRTDMILGEDNVLWVLEINTIPGLTETSLLPQAARAVGIEFSDLLDRIIEAALNRKR